MGYRALVQNAVVKAFKGIGDLAQTVTFLTYPKSSFNFNTGYNESIPNKTSHRVFIEETKNEDKNIRVKTIYADTNQIPDIKFTEAVLINSELWKIGKLITHNDFVTKFEVFRER